MIRKSRSSVSSSRPSPARRSKICAARAASATPTFYKWRQVPRMDVPDARLLRDLEAENHKLRKLLPEAHRDIHALNTAFGVRH